MMTNPTADEPMEAIAIIGMAGRFPGANSVDELWQHLLAGTELVREFTDEELLADGVDPALISDPSFVKAGGVLDDVHGFDHRFFGLSPREAALTDPQHRQFLECAWEAFESAGYTPESTRGNVGVFAGGGTSDYLLYNIGSNPDMLRSLDYLDMTIANDRDQLPTRVSYKLNLTGPSVAIQTACSTSLVAVHMACESLLNQQCDLALAGGASIKLPQAGYLYQPGGVASPDGHVRTFDADGQGAVFGNGVGVVVLKRLSDALADNDLVYAVIRGSAINNDGAAKVGYTAPSVEGQRRVIVEALAAADVDPDTISYVEAHGTATALGDPIEITALTQAFRASTDRVGFVGIGSVKTNVGHLVAASGVTGLIKTALALHHEVLPASLHFTEANPAIDFATSPFKVVQERTSWPRGERPRRAGVSSFGIGGTNAHAVLEEAPLRPSPPASAHDWQLLPLSAQSSSALETATERLARYLGTPDAADLGDVAYTLQVGRRAFAQRRAVIASSRADALVAIAARDAKYVVSSGDEARDREVAFMFPGGGAQYATVAWGLYRRQSVFRAEVDRCVEMLAAHLGADLRDYLYPEGEGSVERGEELNRPKFAMPALFVVGYALARQLMAWGIHPQAMIGHSVGEYVAACLSGVIELPDALALVALRGRLFETMAPGAMLSVQLPESELRPLLGDNLDLAAINAPSLCVATGPSVHIDELEARLRDRGVEFSRLHLAIGAHSRLVEPILDEFGALLRQIQLRPPTVPFVSNVTGTWITTEQATDPSYWTSHIRSTVRFADGVGELLQAPDRVLLEVGPGQTLTTLARLHPERAADQLVLQTTRHPRDDAPDDAFILGALGRLWSAGVTVDWTALHGGQPRQRVPLPAYPFEHTRHWVERGHGQQPSSRSATPSKLANVADWFYSPSWRRGAPLAPAVLAPGSRWLVLTDGRRIAADLVARLRASGQDVVVAEAAKRWREMTPARYQLDPRREQDYHQLLGLLRDRGQWPDHIVHAWSDSGDQVPRKALAAFDAAQPRGYHSLLFLAHAIAAHGATDPLRLSVLVSGLADVGPGDVLHPERATVLAPTKVIPQEYPHVECRVVDLPASAASAPSPELAEQLLSELDREGRDTYIALRGGQRWLQHFEPQPLADGATRRALRPGGVYLITGGLGQLGFAIASQLAISAGAKLVLTGRSTLPPPAERQRWLDEHDENNPISVRLRRIRELEALGAEVLTVSADVADEAAMRAVLTQTLDRFGALHGVVHAAGLIEGGAIFLPLEQMGVAESERQFGPKARGMCVLQRVLGDRPLDLRYLVSSNAAILGGLGHVAYSAANLFLDTFAQQQRGSSEPWVSINWDLFSNDEPGETPSAPRTSVDVYAIGPHEAMTAFERSVLAAPTGQSIMSTGDLELRLDTWIRRDSVRQSAQSVVDSPTTEVPAAALPASYVAPANDVEGALAKLWQNLLGVSPVGTRDNFFELGGHSLIAVRLFSEIEQKFGVKLPMAILFESPTIELLGAHLTSAEQGEAAIDWGSLVPLRRDGDHAPFFCVHGGGGNVLNFRALTEELGDRQPVYALQAKGLDHEDMPHDRVEDTASQYVEEIRAVQPHGPYYLGGYCYGGLIAWEMAQQLRAEGEEVGLLAMVESYAPGHAATLSFRSHWYRQRALLHLRQLRETPLGDWLPYLGRRARTMRWRIGADLRTRAWQLRYRAYRLIGRDVPVDLVDHMEIAHYAIKLYEPPVAEGRPVLFVARDRGVEGAADPLFGWGGLATEDVEVVTVPGDHTTLFEPPYVQGLASELRKRLDQGQHQLEEPDAMPALAPTGTAQ